MLIEMTKAARLTHLLGAGAEHQFRAKKGDWFTVEAVEHQDADRTYFRLVVPSGVLSVPTGGWRPAAPKPERFPAAINSPYMTYEEAAAYTKSAVKTLQNAKCRGELRAVAGGAGVVFERTELDRWVKARPRNGR